MPPPPVQTAQLDPGATEGRQWRDSLCSTADIIYHIILYIDIYILLWTASVAFVFLLLLLLLVVVVVYLSQHNGGKLTAAPSLILF